MGVSSARLLALPAFLASAVGAKDALSEIFGLEHVDGKYDDALKRWFDLGKIEMALENEIQKNWTEPIFDSEIADLILRLEPTDVKKFNAFQDRFGSQWLNVIPCKNLRLKLSNQQLRIAIGFRLGSKICERHKCVCGKGLFLSKLCKNLSICTEEPRAGSFLKQRISLAIKIANAACVLGTINDKITFDEIFLLVAFVYYIISSRVACSY